MLAVTEQASVQVMIALITSFGAIAVAVVGVKANKANKESKATLQSVLEHSVESPLIAEIHGMTSGIATSVGVLQSDVAILKSRVNSIDVKAEVTYREVEVLQKKFDGHDSRVKDLRSVVDEIRTETLRGDLVRPS